MHMRSLVAVSIVTLTLTALGVPVSSVPPLPAQDVAENLALAWDPSGAADIRTARPHLLCRDSPSVI